LTVLMARTLHQQRITPVYRHSLSTAYAALQQWALAHHKPSPRQLADSPTQMSALLSEYIEWLYAHDKPVSHAKLVLLSVQHRFRHTVRLLRGAWDTFGTWKMKLPLNMRTPAPVNLMWALFVSGILHAQMLDTASAFSWFGAAIGILCSFWGLLRPGEWCKLRRRDVLLPGEHLSSGDQRVVLNLNRPKNQRSMGKQQVAIVDHVVAVRWLKWYCAYLPESVLLFPGGLPKFRSRLKQLLVFLGSGADLLTPSSFRAGGATELFKNGVEIHRIRMMGRWKTITSLDHYVQEASAAAVLIRVDESVAARIRKLLLTAAYLRQAPEAPWWSYFSRGQQFFFVPPSHSHGRPQLHQGSAHRQWTPSGSYGGRC
jgi:hypothetical protein